MKNKGNAEENQAKRELEEVTSQMNMYKENEEEIKKNKNEEARVLEYIAGMRYIAEQDIKDNSYKTIKKTQNLYTESVIKSSIEDLGKINEEQVRENTNIIRKIKRATTLSRTKEENIQVLYVIEDLVIQYFDLKVNNLELKNAKTLEDIRNIINNDYSKEIDNFLSIELLRNKMEYLLEERNLIKDIELKRKLLQAIKLNNVYIKTSSFIEEKILRNMTDEEVLKLLIEKIENTFSNIKQNTYQKQEFVEKIRHKKLKIRMNKRIRKFRILKRNILKMLGKEFKVIDYIEKENNEIIGCLKNDIKKYE